MPRAGQDIPLTLQIDDRNASKYVRARVFNPSQSEISGSPASMAHISQGLYGATLIMPTVEYVRVVYEVYDDAGFTTSAVDYEWVSEVLEADESTRGGRVVLIRKLAPVFGNMGVRH